MNFPNGGQQQGGNVQDAAAAATGQPQQHGGGGGGRGGTTGQPQQSGGTQQSQPGDQAGGQQQQHDDNTPKFTQADYNRFEANIRREYAQKAERDKALIEKGKAAEAMEQEARPLSERVEALSGTVAEKDQTIAQKDLAITRMQLAWDAGLPPAIGRRVTGNTVDEINADIEALKRDLNLTGQQQQQGAGVRPNPQQGVPSAGDTHRTGSVDAGRDLFDKRHGKKEAASSGSST